MKRLTRKLRRDNTRSLSPTRVHFSVEKSTEHGFPHRPSAMAFDDSLSMLFIGTRSGHLRAYGRPGVVYCGEHQDEMCVFQIMCHGMNNQVVTQCLDNYLYLWQLRDENDEPKIHMIKNYRLVSASSFGGAKAISVCCLPKKSPHLYIGTESGNLYILQIEGFFLKDNVVYWNHATAGLQSHTKLHPGSIVALEVHPHDRNKLLIGFEKGSLVLWNFDKNQPERTFPPVQYLQSLCWHPDGRQFITSHSDGSFAVWTANSRNPFPEKSTPYDPDQCKRMDKVIWRGSDSSPLVVFSGGMPRAAYGDRNTVTVMQGASHVALDFSSRVIDFVCTYDDDEAVSLIVLLEEEITAFDLTHGKVREIPRPYLCSLHESPLTAIYHCADVPEDFWESLEHFAIQRLSAGTRMWPVTGGTAVPSQTEPSKDLIITGHEDGSIRFWDVSSCFLGPLYRLSLSALFSNMDSVYTDELEEKPEIEWPPFLKAGSFDQFAADQTLAVVDINFCPQSRILTVGGYGGYVVVATFNRSIRQHEMTVIDVNFSPGNQLIRKTMNSLSCRTGVLTMKPGFQPEQCILCRPTMPVTKVEVSSDWGLLSVGTSRGVALIDCYQKQCILVKCTVTEDAPERSLWRFQSLRKSMRNSFRRLRSQVRRGHGRGQGDGDKRATESQGTLPNGQRQRQRRVPMATVRNVEQEERDKNKGNGVRSLHFADTFAYGPSSFPSLWAGTTSGNLLSFHIHFPSMQQRKSELLWAEQTAKEYHLQHGGAILQVVALDHQGRPMSFHMTTGPDMTAPHFFLIVTNEQLKVISLPSYKSKYKHKVTDINGALYQHSQVVMTKSGDCYLACLTQKGELLAYSIPELQLLHRCPLLEVDDGRGIHKFVFTENGQAFYMSSPSQLQRITLHSDTVVRPLCTLNPSRQQSLVTLSLPVDIHSTQQDRSKVSDQDITDFYAAQVRYSEKESAFVDDMIAGKTPSSQSDVSLDDDVQEVSIDVAIKAQSRWSHKSPNSSVSEGRTNRNGQSQPAKSSRPLSANGTIQYAEPPEGYHKPLTKAVSQPPQRTVSTAGQKKSSFDHREELRERGEKLQVVARTAKQTAEHAQSWSDNTAALVAQQERKPWWKI